MAPFFVLLEVISFENIVYIDYVLIVVSFQFTSVCFFHFWLLQAMQDLFGYEPYPGFSAIVEAKIDCEINEWKEKKQKLIS